MAVSPNHTLVLRTLVLHTLVLAVLVLSFMQPPISTGERRREVVMTPIPWRTLSAAATILMTLVLPATAQMQAQIAWCGNKAHNFSLQMQIRGCSTLIESGKLKDKPLAWSRTNRGIAYTAKGDFDHALADFNAALALDPAYATAFASRGSAYDNKGDHDHAIADFSEAIKLDPNSVDALTGRCAARAEAGRDLTGAIADCNQALKLHDNDVAALNSRGFTYLRLGQFDDAITDFSAALKQNSRLASALYGRGLAKQKKGDTAGGQVDMASANLIQSDIAEEFAGYGVK
jgi:tetratricopeptide (TPR) repeat protein